MKRVKHSKEWWEGYNFKGTRFRNPYHPSLGPVVDSQKAKDWIDGWTCRFHGEKP